MNDLKCEEVHRNRCKDDYDCLDVCDKSGCPFGWKVCELCPMYCGYMRWKRDYVRKYGDRGLLNKGE